MCDGYGKPKVTTIAPPIQIFDPIFQQFLDGTNDPEIKPDEDIVDHVLRLISCSSQLHDFEDPVLPQLRSLFTHLFERYVYPEGIVFGRGKEYEIPLLLFKYISEGVCDPPFQAAYSLQDFLYRGDVCTFTQFYSLFLILSSGQRLFHHA